MENDDYSDIESEEIDNLDYQDDDNPSFDDEDYYGSDEDSSFYDESTDINDNESYRAKRNDNAADDKVTETTNQDDNSSQNGGSEQQQGNKQESGSSPQNDSASGEQSDNKEDNKQNAKQDDGKESGESAEKDGSQNGDDDNGYKAGGSGGVDPNELKEGFGRDEFAKTVGNKDYYKNQRDGLKDRLDNAKKKREELNNNGNNQQNQQQGDSAKPQDNQQNQQQGDSAKPQDNQQNQQQGDLAKPQNNQQNQQHGEKPDDKQKKEEEKAARKAKGDAKKEEREAKRALVKNGIASAKAKAYEAAHPLEAARIKAKNWLKNFIMTHPFLSLLIVVGVMIVFIVFVILHSLAETGGDTRPSNKFDYEDNIRVSVGGNTYRLFSAAASMVYYDTFIGNADSFDKLSVSAKTESAKALLLKHKTDILLKKGWNPDNVSDGEYKVSVGNSGFCDYSYGCYKDIFGGFHQYDSEDFEARTDDVDVKYPGLLNYKSDDKINYEKAEIVFNAIMEVSGYIIVPSDVTGILSDLCNKDGKCTNSVDISGLKTDAIITEVAGGSSYDSIIKTLIDTDDKTYNPSYSIQNHLYRDTSIVSYGGDGGNSYYDYGYSEPVEGIDFWWPVGSKNADSNNLYSGTPVSVNITSYYGARWSSFHEGIDINSSDDDTPIIAISDGMVERAYCESKCNNNPKPSCIAESAFGKTYTCIEGNMYTGSGCQVLVNHGTMPDGSNIKSLYVHLKAGSIVVSAGQRVVKGQRLGTMGSTGCSTGRHLHFGIYTNNGYTHVNPLNFVSPDNPRR